MTTPAQDEIWFERWLWSYVPCHWKGWAVMAMHMAPLGVAIALLIVAANSLHREWITDLVLIPFLAAFFSLSRIAKRHSRPPAS